MLYDVMARYRIENKNEIEKWIANRERVVYWTLKGLTQAIAFEDKSKREHDPKKCAINEFIKIVHKEGRYSSDLIKIEMERLENLGLKNPKIYKLELPHSFFLQFPIALEKPYLSKDDDEFYPNENPVRKDNVFKVPMVSPSTWKGNLRKVISEKFEDAEDRLLGHKKGEEDEKSFRQGRLFFYPTFFDRIDLEVINPHSRQTRAGTHPIYFECAPVNATGIFSLLYIPFDLVGRFEVEEEAKKEPLQDLLITLEAVKAMILEYGFSAKKTSGFGVIKKDTTGQLLVSGMKEPISFNLIEDFTDVFNKVKTIWGFHGKETRKSNST